MTRDDDLRCFAINEFGTGDHPMADERTLPHFNAGYVRWCLTRATKSSDVTDEARTAMQTMLDVSTPRST